MFILLIIIAIIVLVIIQSSRNKQKEKRDIEKYINSHYEKPKSKLDGRNDGYYETPIKLFSEKPESKYSFEDKYQEYKNDVRYSVGFYTSKIKGLYHRHTEEIKRASQLFYGEPLFLEKEPDNPVDRFAIKVKTWDGYCIGYIDSAINLTIGRVMDDCFLIKCFMYQAGYGEIPYQWLMIYTVKDKLRDIKITIVPKEDFHKSTIDAPVQNEVYLIDYKDKIKRLKENIKNSQKSADDLYSKGRIKLYQNALDRIKMYENEIDRIELLMKDVEINKII